MNCVDETDEEPLHCPNMTCPDNNFQCKDSKKCIPLTWFCDHHLDCGPYDHSDEPDSCDKCDEFECHNKVCISYAFYCNGVNNCGYVFITLYHIIKIIIVYLSNK